MKFSPAPYSFRNTLKLVKRDIKDMFTSKHKAEAACFQHRFHDLNLITFDTLSPPAATSTLHASVSNNQPECLQTSVRACAPTRPSVSTAATTFIRDVSSDPPTPSTATEYSLMEESSPPFPYATAYPKLQHWWQFRPQDMTLEQRYRERGVAIVLAIAFCYSAQNPVYHILGRSLECLQAHWTNETLSTLLATLDDDRAKAVQAVEALLVPLYPGVDVHTFLYQIGDPTMMSLMANEKDALHHKLCELLLPEFRNAPTAEYRA